MTPVEETQALILRYFRSWQEPADFDAFRSCLANDVVFDAGEQSITGADALSDMVRQAASPWKEVDLLAWQFGPNEAALVYQGIGEDSEVHTQVAERLTVSNGKITHILAVIQPVADS